ncbi:hypothetical protein RFI_16482, partial [Reticulomyxa filosa]
ADITDQSTADNLSQMNQQMHDHIQTLSQRLEIFEKQIQHDVQETTKRIDEIRPKLARLKTRKDFTSEEAYVEYVGGKIKEWDVQKDGRILVRVNPDLAEGKAKHFIGYVGEPVKWNSTICKVQWFGLPTQESKKKCNENFLLFSFNTSLDLGFKNKVFLKKKIILKSIQRRIVNYGLPNFVFLKKN